MASKIHSLKHLLLLFQITLAASLDIIPINQSFTEGNLLVSKGNNFAFGFFSPGNATSKYLGIWFHQVSKPSVVWVANRNNPITGSSGILSINPCGNLVLYNDPNRKVPLWSTNISGEVTDSCVVQLLDSGNLVLLRGRNKRLVWQSFDHPTDTLLPGMRISLNPKTGLERILTSWRSEDDPGTGDYSIKFNPRGIPQIFLYKGSNPHWRSSPWPWRTFSDLYNYTYELDQEELYLLYHIKDASIIIKITIDDQGFNKWLRWQKSDNQWKEFWSTPKYRCDFYAQCGAYSKCDPSNPDRYECSCLPGYEPKSPRDWYLRDASGGCVRKRLESSSVCGHGEGFVKVENVKFPDTSTAAFVGMNMSLVECEQECLRNCSCSAYTNVEIAGKDSRCVAWYGELIDTADHMDNKHNLYVRVDATELVANARKSSFFLRKGLDILILSVVLAWLTVILFAYLWIRRKKSVTKNKWKRKLFDPTTDSINYKNTLVASELGRNSHPPDIEFFDLGTIVAATNNFSPANKLGQGGFGSVYKGQISNEQEIAVKRLSKSSGQGIEEFKNEVMLIAKLQHRNLVKLLGCCIQGGEQMLIYEYLPNKSLDSFLFVSGKKSTGFYQEDSCLSLIGHMWKLWEEQRVLEMVDSSLEGSYPPQEALRCTQIGLLCVTENAVDRPTMSEVVVMLSSETAALPSPKQPAFIFRTSCSNAISLAIGEEEDSSSINEVTMVSFVTR
ncbi:G-type lectin S-receptor-like serine/threonine-protein kinase At1g11410 isoform X2 [Hevea brasiliensis]|uniref:G-type lectin S-receptor-like serine/threonine-protein kinase At1g11410 isoform X2 n=1 Tax=Hevea brasiliensis TaxID=3981 RepID=UPI0025DCB885|nr:G-type lectin S-receptor-like serine/threonine-protein kinase At1g11410 isoform X2 [Hevea brasiliensis]